MIDFSDNKFFGANKIQFCGILHSGIFSLRRAAVQKIFMLSIIQSNSQMCERMVYFFFPAFVTLILAADFL